MPLPIDLLFVPTWLWLIRPRNPVDCFADDPVYPPSRLTARTVTSDMRPTANGTIVPREEQLATQARVVGALRARKERATARQYAGRWSVDRMIDKAERRAKREAKRIMNRRRQDAIAAFTMEGFDG